MPTISLYLQEEFPAVLKWQAIAFMRVEWPFVFQDEGMFAANTYPPAWLPVHFAAHEGDSLISYAAAIQRKIVHAGETYTAYGFGNMFTFPPYRRLGYGRQVLDVATQFFRHSYVDLGVLFCDPSLEAFYEVSGWEAITAPTYVGYEGSRLNAAKMMHFVSEKGRAAKSSFNTHPLVIGEAW